MPIISFGAPCERLSAHQRIHPISQRIQVRNLRQLRLGALGVLLTSIGLAGNQAHALGFAEALDLAEQHSPRITAQRLQIDAATSTRQAAGTLPDPKLSVGIENFPISGMDRFSLTRESMTMQRLALMQEVPNRAKRDAQIAGAEAKVERERATLAVQRLQIRQELSQAWILAQAIEQRDQVLTGLLSENQRLQDSLTARIAGGDGPSGRSPDGQAGGACAVGSQGRSAAGPIQGQGDVAALGWRSRRRGATGNSWAAEPPVGPTAVRGTPPRGTGAVPRHAGHCLSGDARSPGRNQG